MSMMNSVDPPSEVNRLKTELARPMNQQRAIRIGVIADTHGLFDSTVGRHFKGVDHILHAGDIGDGSVIEQLEQIAPVTVVSGHVDNDEQSGFPSEAVIKLAGLRIALRHILYAGEKLTKNAIIPAGSIFAR